jgi:hypothetical protein
MRSGIGAKSEKWGNSVHQKASIEATYGKRFTDSEKCRQRGFRAPKTAIYIAEVPKSHADSARFPARGAESLSAEGWSKKWGNSWKVPIDS